MTGRLPFSAAVVLTLAASAAQATPSLVVDLDSGEVLQAQEATRSWYPASVTKLMTAYVALQAVREGRMSLQTPMVVSARAARMAPSKMGFKPGSEITLDNALKIIMVKSANDVSVTIAEGVGGSVEGFAQLMNDASTRLGMTNSHWVNPNGLPDDRQVTSARDMAILARALHRDFPDHRALWNIGAIQFGQRYMANHNGLIGRYPGADGMKTGFTCAAGFNVVATASRGGRRLIAVVFGQPSAAERTAYAAQLFDKGFNSWAGQGSLASLGGGGVSSAPNMRGEVCVRRGKGGGWQGEEEDLSTPIGSYAAATVANNPQLEFLFAQNGGVGAQPAGRAVAFAPRARAEPTMVYLGRAPGWSGSAVGPTAVASRGRGAKPGAPAAAEPGVETATALADPAAAPLKDKRTLGARAPVAAGAAAMPLRLVPDDDETSGKPGKAKAAGTRPAMVAAAPAKQVAAKPTPGFRQVTAVKPKPASTLASKPASMPAARPASMPGKPPQGAGKLPLGSGKPKPVAGADD